MSLRLGGGQGALTLRAMVCWVRDFNRGWRVGVRFLAGREAALAALMREASTVKKGA